MRRTISQTFSITLGQLEKLTEAAARNRSSLSALVQEAIDIVLERYDRPKRSRGKRTPSRAGTVATRQRPRS
jgi:hypothetical protein